MDKMKKILIDVYLKLGVALIEYYESQLTTRSR